MNERPNLRDSLFPLRSHDIFGYMIPGATFIMLIYMFEFCAKQVFMAEAARPSLHTPIFTAVRLAPSHDSWALMLLYLLGTLLACYVIGHVVASIAVLCLDRILVAKGHWYPWRTLLQMPVHDSFQREVSRPFYKGLVFWVNLYLIIRYAGVVWKVNVFLHAAQVLGYLIIIALLIKVFLARGTHRRWPKASKRSWSAFASIYNLLGNTLNRFTGTTREFGEDFTRRYKSHFRRVFGVKAEDAGTGNYWLTSIFVRDRYPVLHEEIQRWHNLYAFSRNLSGAFYLAFLYCFVSIYLQEPTLAKLTSYQQHLLKVFPPLTLTASILLVIRYYYLFVTKHARLVFRIFVYASHQRG